MRPCRFLLLPALFALVTVQAPELPAQAPAGPEKVLPKPRTEGEQNGPQTEKKPGGGPESLDAHIRQIEDALFDELAGLERRIQLLKDRLRPTAPPPQLKPAPESPEPRPAAKRPPGPDPAEDAALEDRHKSLLKRQDELVSRWLELDRSRASAPPGDGEAERKRVRQAAEIETELKDVLREVLELRESARERQIARLRQELDSLERALGARSSREDREKAVQARLKELLGRKELPGDRK